MRSDKLRQHRVKAVAATARIRRGFFNRIILHIACNLVDKECPLESAIANLLKETVADYPSSTQKQCIWLLDYLISVVERAEEIDGDRFLVLAKPLFK